MKTILSLIVMLVCAHLPFTAIASNSAIEKCATNECEHWFSEYKRKSREGYADAMEMLGTFYHVGYGTEIDKEQALRWYKRSSKYFSVAGSYKAGLFYLTEADYVDLEKGVSYLKKAARKNHPEASYLLGMIFSQDELGPHDYDEADKWLSKAFVTSHQQVKSYTNYLKSQNVLTADHFPQLAELAREYEQTVLVSNTNDKVKAEVKDDVKEVTASTTLVANIDSENSPENKGTTIAKTEFPDDEMEVIEVTPLTLVQLFEADFAFFETFMAEKRDAQARKGLYRRPCSATVSCSEASADDFTRMVNNLASGALRGN
ncbi:hypothetical protein ND16A_3212 [Thalassotalea sp. ND16A]|nr:hypothetical protein ND16A_3212 [Thalassotalea sp. ND16A]